MSSGGITLSQINAGHAQQAITLRLLRFWCARNVKRSGQVMGMDLLFVDRESTVAHATINVSNMSTFQPLLRDGAVYVLNNFDVRRSITRYRLSDLNVSLRLNDSTSLVEIAEPVPEIPKQVFRFRTHAELESLALSNSDLPDIMGQVSSTKTALDIVTNDPKRISLNLTMQSGHEVRLTAFDDKACELAKLLKNRQSDFSVILATNINPKMFAGKLYVNATAGTRFFFDGELQATRDCIESFKNTNSLTRYRNVHNIQHISIAEMNSFVLTADPQDIEYLCTGKIIDIRTRRGWNFLACSVCGKKIHREGSSLSCNTCADQSTVADVKYRVELVVADDSSKAVFVVFNGEMEKLISVDASSLTTQTVNNGEHSTDAEVIPEIIKSLIGSTFTFHLRLTDFNFGPYHESFAVSRIIKEPTDMPKPSFPTEDPPMSDNTNPDNIENTVIPEIPKELDPGMKIKKQKLS